ncbi:hypothetical protein ACFPRL_32735 [Pseudoclavibacter helvolus]
MRLDDAGRGEVKPAETREQSQERTCAASSGNWWRRQLAQDAENGRGITVARRCHLEEVNGTVPELSLDVGRAQELRHVPSFPEASVPRAAHTRIPARYAPREGGSGRVDMA